MTNKIHDDLSLRQFSNSPKAGQTDSESLTMPTTSAAINETRRGMEAAGLAAPAEYRLPLTISI